MADRIMVPRLLRDLENGVLVGDMLITSSCRNTILLHNVLHGSCMIQDVGCWSSQRFDHASTGKAVFVACHQ